MFKPLKIFWIFHKAEAVAVTACVVLIGITGLIAWISHDWQSAAEREFHLGQGRHQALLLEVNARDTIASLEDALGRIKREFEAAGTRIDLKRLMADYRAIAGHVTVASVADAQGQLVLSTLPIRETVSIADLRHYRAHVDQDHGRLFFGWPVVGRLSGKWSFHASCRINRPDGSFGGVAVIAVDFSYWARLLKDDAIGKDNVIALLGTDGRARSVHGSAQAAALMAADWGFVSSAAASGTSGAVEGPAGLPGTWLYRAVQGYPLIVAVRLDQDRLWQRLQEIRNQHNAAAFSVVILLILLTGLLLKYFARQRLYYSDREKIAGVLQQSEERFRAVFDQAETAMALRPVGRRDLPWQKVNRRFCEFLGYTEAELLRLPASAITVPEEDALAAGMDVRIASGEITNYSREKQYRRKDGSTVWGLMSTTVLHYPDGQPAQALCIVQDIDARKRDEAVLRENETRLRIIAEHIGEGLALYDPEDRLSFYNETYRRFQLPATPDLRPGLPFEQLARDRGHLLAAMGEITDVEAFVAERIGRHRNPPPDPIERRRPDGGIHLIREVRTPDGYTVVSFVDVTELTRREAELRDSESRFRALFESAGVGLSVRPAHDRGLPWVAVNDRFCEITGYSREELLRMCTSDITPADTQERAMSDNRRLLSGEVRSYMREKRLLCKDGSERWVVLSVTLLSDAQGRPSQIMSSYQDIHASKMAEVQLQASEERLRAIIAAEPECVAIVSPAGDLLEMNPAGLRMLEAANLGEMQAAPLLRQIAPRFRKSFVRLQHRVRRGETGVLEFEAIGLRGKHCWLEIHAAPLRDPRGDVQALLGISRDVTEQRAAREALAAERNLLRTLVDSLPDPVHVKDAQLRYVLANAAWMRVRAPGYADITGKTSSEVVVEPGKRRMIEAEDRGVIESVRPIPMRLESVDVPGIGLRWYMVAKLPLLDQAGRISGLISINRDVTEIRQRAEEVEQLNAQLEQRVADRTVELAAANEELEAFASAVSHDLRAPLRHIDGFSGLLLDDCGRELSATGRNYLDRIRNATSRMSALIEDLLRLSRLMRGDLNLAEVDLAAMATELIGELRRDQPDRQVAVRIASPLKARGDAGLLRVVMANLLQNAWKFTGKKGNATIEFSAMQRDGVQVYCVRDNGAGFDMAYAGRLFGTFQRLHHESEFAGTGVGLATVRRIVRRHGGDVCAESAVNEGASFYFTLEQRLPDYGTPAPAPALLAAEPPPPAGEPSRDGLTVLLVDDDPDVLLLTSRMLQNEAYEILTAANGALALDLLRLRPVDVIVSDFSMPGMHGARLLAEAARVRPDSLRLIVSGQTLNRAMQDGLQRGDIHFYFEKQASFDLVRDCIRAWVADRPSKT